MNAITENIDRLTADVSAKRETLDNALFIMQTWVARNASILTDADRTIFSQTLATEKEPQQRDGSAYGDDSSLVSSILRLHTMRLLYRYDFEHEPPLAKAIDDPYDRGTRQLRIALHAAEQAINEARVDTAIVNAHQIMGDGGANHRWLQDALSRLQAATKTDLLRLVETIPSPTLPTLNLFQKATFFVFGIKPAEIARRNLRSLRQLAELQNTQLAEMAHLLLMSFEAIDDRPGVSQTLALLTRVSPTGHIDESKVESNA